LRRYPRHAPPGAAFIVFRGGRHVADPCDFTDDELTGYWADVRTAAKAIEQAYRSCQLNYATFDNALPHVHTHITPRYPDDPAPGRPLPDSLFQNAPTLSPQQLAEQVERLRRHIPSSQA
jgi:diadenosine tetraphosphate (Ap4A) HIT family hydrolase